MPSPSFSARPDELGRIAFALDRLTDRIEASETRTGLAISGVEHSVRHAMARIETAEREHLAVATRFDAAAEHLAAEQARASDRLRWMEDELSGPRSAEALKILEDQITRVGGDFTDGEARSRATLADLEARLANVEAGEDPAAVIEEAVSRLAQRLADAEGRTGDALDGLRDSLAQLDQRMYAADSSVRGDMDSRLTALADQLSQRVEAARNEVAERLAATDSTQVEARLGEMAEQIARADQRSARAIETMGREVLTMAETLNRRVQSAEQRSAEAIEQVGGEIARIAGAVENRLGRTDQLHAEALERLGAEIGKITDRLTDRIIQSERRAAQAIDDVGEQVAKVTERIEQRHERAASDLAERIRQSEERTARLLADASQRLGAETPAVEAQTTEETDEIAPSPSPSPSQSAWSAVAEELPAAPAVFGAELFSRAEPVSQPALDPGNPTFNEEDFAHVDAFAPEGFAPIAELDDEDRFEIDGPPETLDTAPEAASEATNAAGGEPPVETVMELGVEPKGEDEAAAAARAAAQLSTRQVIEQARAAARAAAAAPRPRILHAPERRPRAMRAGGLFRSLKARPPSTWQTALMVAGGAAFLSVGAAGVVLMEGPNATREALPFAASPRAAVALTPDAAPPASPLVAETKALSAAPSTTAAATSTEAATPTEADAVGADYVKVAAAVEQKQPGALARLKAIADGGHAPAQMFLARLYETGQAGVVQNLGEARRWTLRAAEAGDPTAMHNLALYYFRGEGGPQDTAAAAQWFKKAAEHGVVDSQYNLGLLYQSGSGVPRDLAQAYKWFSIAANSGDGEARSAAIDLEGKLPSAKLAQAESQASAFQPAGVTATPETAASGASVASAQKILGRLGYYKGRPDGTNSRDMRLAVTAYQRDQGLAATGSLDPATVSRLSVFSR
ncbi:MAG TPA: peptidoglycan-binding protein [Phenylobacterium sp.]|uniref:peptidoglycan-binding protein n=1 Tax=Phenylobacterium sp. TaxID=1871053 RepID=UPI002D3DFDA7|nr:peptidoglycan-binding protein [Phenylobacterium sp.]HZZ66760.1 peptidoglycan-binding protein [Phenylobacterium sp.]